MIKSIALASILLVLVSTLASAQTISPQTNVSLKVGATIIIHGVRADSCGAPAPSWANAAGRLPPSSLGIFLDGGPGTRTSIACGGPVPARAVRFKAVKAGTEILTIEGDKTTITVR
jgi:hypothetical protein